MEKLRKLKEQHENDLAFTTSLLAASMSAGVNAVLDLAQGRQKDLDIASSLAINQLVGSANDLSIARQEFDALSTFIKETTSKAYNQAFLLDVRIFP
ncbi:hypothetical protein EW145_g2728 [Phellinidium pouzarii]|uniref:Uncharacterized protein n=1 Tax=Phellinidium pouzarii TaxID=167371 RepID=A0A4S4LA78_9AGAM|nr:hypothetical protein EW145_g2728 [Phellinidium pouzarii]